MALDFPSSPTNGQTFGNYTYDSTAGAWRSSALYSMGLPIGGATSTVLVKNSTSNYDTSWNLLTDANISPTAAISNTKLASGATPTTFTLPNTLASASWIKLGTWTTQQNGYVLAIEVSSHTGYNATITQNQITTLYFKTSNGAGGQNIGGVYGDGSATRNSLIGTTTSAPSTIRVVQDSLTQFSFYGNFSTYTGASTYRVTIPTGTSWADSSTTVSTPSGTYLDITPLDTASAYVPIMPTGGTYASVSANGMMTFNNIGMGAYGIFTAEYDEYEIHLNVKSATAADYLYFRYCIGSSTNSANVYYGGAMYSQGTTVGTWVNGGTVNTYSNRIGYFYADNATIAVLRIVGPFGTSQKTNCLYQSKYSSTGTTVVTGGVAYNATTSLDGIFFSGEAGTGAPGGTMQVFGLRK